MIALSVFEVFNSWFSFLLDDGLLPRLIIFSSFFWDSLRLAWVRISTLSLSPKFCRTLYVLSVCNSCWWMLFIFKLYSAMLGTLFNEGGWNYTGESPRKAGGRSREEWFWESVRFSSANSLAYWSFSIASENRGRPEELGPPLALLEATWLYCLSEVWLPPWDSIRLLLTDSSTYGAISRDCLSTLLLASIFSWMSFFSGDCNISLFCQSTICSRSICFYWAWVWWTYPNTLSCTKFRKFSFEFFSSYCSICSA